MRSLSMNPIFRWSAVSVAARSVREAESPSRRQILRTSLAPRESWRRRAPYPRPRRVSRAWRRRGARRRGGALDAVLGDAGPQPGFLQLALDAPHDLEGVLEGVEVVVRALFDAPREGSSGTASSSLPTSSGGPSTSRRSSYRFRRAFLRLVFGLGAPWWSRRPFGLAGGLARLAPLGRLPRRRRAAVHKA